jgi:plasmid stabilization system protein ParE
MKPLRLSFAALRDSEEIAEFTLETFGSAELERLRSRFADAFDSVERRPNSGRPVSSLAKAERVLRSKLVHRTFLVIYEVTPSEIRVVRILHAARDLPGELNQGSSE